MDTKKNNNDSVEKVNKDKLNKFIGHQYNNVMVLAGAGSSISSDKNDTGLTMYQLADDVNDKINQKDYSSNKGRPFYNLYKMACLSNFYKIYKDDFNKYKCQVENSEKDSSMLKKQIKKVKKYPEMYSHALKKDTKQCIAEKLMFIFNNFELLLSNVNSYKNFIDIRYSKSNVRKYNRSINKIHSIIRADCTIEYEPKNFDHIKFIKKLQALIPNDRRLKIYSTNYDTLFEQAAERCGMYVIDGFSYSIDRKFTSNALNIDFVNRTNDSKSMTTSNTSLHNNVIKIYQLHGSISWYKYKAENDVKNENGVYKTNPKIATNKINIGNKYRAEDNKDNDKSNYYSCMIFPSQNKYQQSYEDPFFDLFFNFQRDLHKNNTLLIVVGFSFGDMHIKRMVYDAMVSNAGLSMAFISYSGKKNADNVADFFDKAKGIQVFGNRELLFKGSLSDFANDLDLKAIFNKQF